MVFCFQLFLLLFPLNHVHNAVVSGVHSEFKVVFQEIGGPSHRQRCVEGLFLVLADFHLLMCVDFTAVGQADFAVAGVVLDEEKGLAEGFDGFESLEKGQSCLEFIGPDFKHGVYSKQKLLLGEKLLEEIITS